MDKRVVMINKQESASKGKQIYASGANRIVNIEGRLEVLSNALARDGVRLACLFGSVLEQPPARDVDLAVLFREYSFQRYLDTLEATCQALGTRRVDLVVLNRANALLKLRALLAGKLIFAETPTTQAEAVAEALFEYQDYRQFMAQYRELLDWRCQEGLSVTARRLDRERVEGYLSTLDEAVAQIRRLQTRFTSFEEFRYDVDTRELCVHYLRLALESVLDICRHFLAVVGLSLAELETTNLIELAGEKGLLEPAFAHRIRGMAGMRNAIVHVYWRLDYQAIYGAVTEQLTDFDEFARQVRAYLGVR
ncbi:MAG: HepT-like ribonuclease domain-containing protein [Anaerolineae bacterium]